MDGGSCCDQEVWHILRLKSGIKWDTALWPCKAEAAAVGQQWRSCLDRRTECVEIPIELVPGLDATNDLAERSIRPVVVIRNISGGSRSAEGTKTRMALASLLGTWQARRLNPFDECFKQLSHAAVSPA